MFQGARVQVLGAGAATVRAVVVSGGPLSADILTPARVALSVPLVNAHTHPLVTAPIFASHGHDLQTFSQSDSSDAGIAHVGPPTVNIEAKLVGLDDEAVEKGADPVGTLHVRGPIVGKVLGIEEDAEAKEEPWAPTGYTGKAQTNGSFKVW